MDVDQIKAQVARTWSLGEYSRMSHQLYPAAVALCDACAVSAGQEVLDVAAGDGNFALACAREGASVVASDLAPGMVERGRARTAEEGFDVDWLEADVEDLPFEDERFDCVGSVFGAMMAPRPRRAAEELFRVVRPGGTVGLVAWSTRGYAAELFALGRSFAPPSDQPLSDEWSVEANVRERFDGLAARFELEFRPLVWEGDSVDSMVATIADSAPPWVAARERLPRERYEQLIAEARELTGRLAREGEDGRVALESEYASIVARKRG